MKAHILKISGAKNEKEFYKMFPTQESFMAKHGKELHQLLSMQNGGDTNKNGVPDIFEVIQPERQVQAGEYPPNPNFNFHRFGNNPYTSNQPPQADMSYGNQGIFTKQNPMQPQDPFARKDYAGQWAKNNPLPSGINPAPASELALPKSSYPKATGPSDNPWETIGNMMPGVGKVVGGFKALKAERDALKGAQQWNQVSAAALKASQTPDVNMYTDIADTQRRLRQALTPTRDANALFPTYGVGTNVLTKHGGKMNFGGEIMNTFAPGDIYDDLGYEPLSQSDQVKSFAYGGPMAQAGFNLSGMLGAGADSSFDWTGAGNAAGNLTGNLFGNNAGARIGGGAADIFGVIPGVGPIASAIAKPLFSTIGGLFDRNPRRTEQQQRQMMGNISNMSGVSALKGFQNEYSGVFRTGGNLRTNSVGDIETISGGYLEPMSYNPYTPGTGITSMIRGQSHDESNGRHSGVIMNYAGNQVEAERGEPISERQDGGNVGNTSAVIAGDQTFNDLGATLYPELAPYKGQKVKNINAEIAREDAKNNKFSKKNTSMLKNFEVKTPFDKLTMNSLTLNQKGIDAQYKHNADKVNKLLEYQDAVNKTAEEWGVDSGQLSRGKLKFDKTNVAQDGTSIYKHHPTAENYLNFNLPNEAPDEIWKGTNYANKWEPKVNAAFSDTDMANKIITDIENYQGEDAKDVKNILALEKTKSGKIARAYELATDQKVGPYHKIMNALIDKHTPKPPPAQTTAQTTTINPNYGVTPYRQAGWETIAGQILPWIRKTPGEPLLGDQLAGEMFAMSNNQVEPVQARFYRPELDVPYDISYQDQLNENQADFNAMQRAVGNNPEALAALAAQKYGANSKILGEQFRANQAMKNQVYSGNRATLNDAQLKNLGIADQQYVRQAQAKSNTKLAMQEALNSVASKIGQNRLENRTLQTYANMFPQYSYDKNFNILNTGAPAQFDINQGIYQADDRGITHVPVYDKKGKVIGMKPIGETDKKAEEKVARQGNIVKAFKGY